VRVLLIDDHRCLECLDLRSQPVFVGSGSDVSRDPAVTGPSCCGRKLGDGWPRRRRADRRLVHGTGRVRSAVRTLFLDDISVPESAGRPGSANDLAAETFVVAFGRRDRFSAQRPSALPWLYGIAGNLLRMHQRFEDRRLRAYTRASSDARIGLSDTDDADERLDAVALRPPLADALAELSPSRREALALHVWAGLSDDEIAEAVGCSSGAVRTLGVLARLGWVVGLGDAEPPADLV
jgi:RNA polymerase sigma factor (sigma-70 family)